MQPEQTNDLARRWLAAKATSEQWIEYERGLRMQLVVNVFGNPADGTHKADFGNDFELKLIQATTWSVKNGPDLHEAARQVSSMQPYVNVPDKLFKWKPSLIVSAWKQQPAAVQGPFLPLITAKPAAPQLTLEQKVKK